MVLNSLFFAVVASFVVPVILAFAFAKGNTAKIPGKKLFVLFLLGSVAYAIGELLIRELLLLEGILPMFSDTDWYYVTFENVTSDSMLYYSVFTGVTMALSQELVRFFVFFIAYKIFKGDSTAQVSSIVYGFGSGWVEAIAVLGIMAFSYLAQTISESGVLDEVGATRALLAGIERIVYIFYHVGYAMLVVYGFKNSKKILMLLLAIVLRAVLTTVDCYLGKMGLEYTTLIFINAAMAAAVCGLAVLLWKRSEKNKANVDNKS